MTNAPRSITVYLCIILAIIGLILYLVDFIGVLAVPYLGLVGFVLLFVGWLILTIACFVKGL